MLKIKHGFTLAEMMVVMLILSIIMAAMAPVMTTRNKLDQSSPWSWSTNGSDAYYGLGDAQVAMIGQEEVKPDDDAARLIINAGDGKNHILFKRGDLGLGSLRFENSGLLLGSLISGNLSNDSLGIGNDISLSSKSTAVGNSSRAVSIYSSAFGINSDASRSYSSAFGADSEASGDYSSAFGADSEASGDYSSVYGAKGTASAENASAFGSTSSATSSNSTAIGFNSYASGQYSTSVGTNSSASAENSASFGAHAATIGTDALAIGYNSHASGASSIAVGEYSKSSGDNSIAIGASSTTVGKNSIIIGTSNRTEVDDNNAIAIGTSVQPDRYGIVIGNNSSSNASTQYINEANIIIGNEAIAEKGNSNILIGSPAHIFGNDSQQNGNVLIGVGSAVRGGSYNTLVGTKARAFGGDYITAIGANACLGANRGSNKTCIGANSGPQASSPYANDDEERIFIGSQSKFNGADAVLEVHNISETSNFTVKRTLGSYRIPNNASGVVINGDLIVKGHLLISAMHGSSSTDIKNHSSSPFYPAAADDTATMVWDDRGQNSATLRHPLWNTTYNSDRRLKYVSKENTSGLDKIRQLKVFNYTFKKDDKKTPHVGVIAQDLQKVFPDAVKKGVDGFLNIRFEDMFYAMINAIKELDAKYQAQEKRINELEARIEKLEARIK